MNKIHVFRLYLLSLFIGWTVADVSALDVQSLKTVEASVVQVVENVLPCTVGLGSPDQPQSGSGVIVSADGLILTAAHVTQATGDILEVFFADGTQARAKALGSNFDRDAGFARIVDKGEYPFVEVGRSGDLIENQWCIAVGHPGGFQPDRTAPIRLGRIISKNHNKFVRTNCTLIGGDSGGPLFDIDGKLIGIHSNIGADLSENNHIPIDVFRDNWNRLVSGERWGQLPGRPRQDPDRAVLGVRPRGTNEAGLRVDVAPGGSAEEAGMKSGDVIVSIQGQKTNDTTALLKIMHDQKAGHDVDVVVMRDKKELTFKIQLVRAKDIYGPKKADSDDDDKELSAHQAAEKILNQTDLFTSDQLDEKLREMVAIAETDGSTIDITPEAIRAFGGKPKFVERLNRFVDEEKANALLKGAFSKYRGIAFTKNLMKAYEPIIAPASACVAPIMRRDRQVALGLAVSDDGLFLTKSSEVKGRKIQVEVAPGERLEAIFIKDFPEHDLALVKVNAKSTPIHFYSTDTGPSLGSFVVAAGIEKEPIATGVISVQKRNLARHEKPFLGVTVKTVDAGLEVTSIDDKSTAGKMHMKKGDLIMSLDGVRYETEVLFIRALLKKKPGDRVRLEINRDGTYMGKIGKLGNRKGADGREMLGYPQGGRLSSNRSDYPNALQTDLPLRPQDCGSPLVDLNGRVLGVNIARAGRIKSYAITADVIEKLLGSM